MKREYFYIKKNKYPKLKNAEERLRSICYERGKKYLVRTYLKILRDV